MMDATADYMNHPIFGPFCNRRAACGGLLLFKAWKPGGPAFCAFTFLEKRMRLLQSFVFFLAGGWKFEGSTVEKYPLAYLLASALVANHECASLLRPVYFVYFSHCQILNRYYGIELSAMFRVASTIAASFKHLRLRCSCMLSLFGLQPQHISHPID